MKIAFVSNVPKIEPYHMALLATFLRSRGIRDHIKIIDSTYDNILDSIRNYNPNIICLSAITSNYSITISLAKKIRNINNAKIILGGIHISMMPSSFNPIFDIGVIGEGEETLFDIINHYRKHNSLLPQEIKKIKGLVYFDNENLCITESREPIQDLDSIPIPARSFLNPNYFMKSRLIGTEDRVICTTMMTSRGCPVGCTFCATGAFFGKNMRYNSPERVAEEVSYLHRKYNVKYIQIYDDIFTLNKPRLRRIISMLKNKGVLGKVMFGCNAHVATIDEEMCSILKEMNVLSLSFGFESGSDKVLKFLKNNSSSIEKIKNAITLAKRNSFYITGGLILGSPNELEEDYTKTETLIDFMKEQGVDLIWVFMLKPFPGTQLWKYSENNHRLHSYIDWEEFSIENFENPLLLNQSITKERYYEIVKNIRKKIKYFELKTYTKRFMKSPIETIIETIKNGGILKFFTGKRKFGEFTVKFG